MPGIGRGRPGAAREQPLAREERDAVAARDRRRRPRRHPRRRRSGAGERHRRHRRRIRSPPRSARRRALRAKGAELVIALAPVDKPLARRVARDAAVDLVVLGRQVGNGMERAEKVGNAFIVAPADELQRVGRIDIVWRGKGPLVDAGGPDAAALRRVEIDRSIGAHRRRAEGVDGRRAAAIRRSSRPSAPSATALVAERDAAGRALEGAATARYFTNRLIPLRRSLPRDEKVAARDAQAGRGRSRRSTSRARSRRRPAEPGRPFYVGDAKCTGCHKTAAAFWKKTVHASAWKTLVDGGKQNDYKCVGCHVTGYGEVGGTSLGHTDRLRDVQCEVCHGPGSTHVAEEGLEEPLAVAQADAGQHLHRLPHRAALGHLPVRGLPARHHRRRPRRERAQEAGRRPDRAHAAHRRARAREGRGRKAEEGRLTRQTTVDDASDADGARRSAAGRAGRARCCRR